MRELSCRQAVWLGELKGSQLISEVKMGSCVDTYTLQWDLDDFQGNQLKVR